MTQITFDEREDASDPEGSEESDADWAALGAKLSSADAILDDITGSVADKILGDTGLFKPKKVKANKPSKERKHPKEKKTKALKEKVQKEPKAPKVKAPKEPKVKTKPQKEKKEPKAAKEKVHKEPKAPKEKVPKEPKAPKEKVPKEPKSAKTPSDKPKAAKKSGEEGKPKKKRSHETALVDGEVAPAKPKKSKKSKEPEEAVLEETNPLALVTCSADRQSLGIFRMDAWPGKADVPFAKAQKFCKNTQQLMAEYVKDECTGSFIDVNAPPSTLKADKIPPIEAVKYSKECNDFIRLHTQADFEHTMKVMRNVCRLMGKQTLGVDIIHMLQYYAHSGCADMAFLAQKSQDQLVNDVFESSYTIYPPPVGEEATANEIARAQNKRFCSIARYLIALGLDDKEEMVNYELAESTIQKCIEPLCFAECERLRLLHKGCALLGEEENGLFVEYLAKWGITSIEEAAALFESAYLMQQVVAAF